MKTNKTFINIAVLSLMSFAIIGCGSSSSNDTVEPTAVTEDVAVTACTVPDNTSSYQIVKSGDIISKVEQAEDTNNPELAIFQSSNGEKRVCTQSGSATIIRS